MCMWGEGHGTCTNPWTCVRDSVCMCSCVQVMCVCVLMCFSLLLIQGGHLHRASRREREWKGVGGEGDINSAGWSGHYPLQRQTQCRFPVMLAGYGSSQHYSSHSCTHTYSHAHTYTTITHLHTFSCSSHLSASLNIFCTQCWSLSIMEMCMWGRGYSNPFLYHMSTHTQMHT